MCRCERLIGESVRQVEVCKEYVMYIRDFQPRIDCLTEVNYM